MVAVTMSSTIHDEDDGAAAAHHETREPAHHATAEPVDAPTMVDAGCSHASTPGVQDAGDRAHGEGAGRAEDRVLAVGVDDHLRRDQPAAGPEHGCRHGPQDPIERPHRNRQRLGHADGGAADGAHDDEAGGVGVGSRRRRLRRRGRRRGRPPSRRSNGPDRRHRSRRCRPVRRRARHRRPVRRSAAAPAASMLPATARAATPASGNPTKVAEPPGPSLDCCPVRPHRCLLSTIWASSGARRRHRERRR